MLPCLAYGNQQVNPNGNNLIIRTKHIDLSKKYTIILKGEVTFPKMEALADALDGQKVINLIITSPGGSVAAGVHFINKVEALRNQGKLERLDCYIRGMAASMAAVISAYCDTVYIHKFALFMIHGASYAVRGHQEDIRTQVEFTEAYLTAIMYDLALRWGISLDELKGIQGRERYLISYQAAGYGFASYVFSSLYDNAINPYEDEE